MNQMPAAFDGIEVNRVSIVALAEQLEQEQAEDRRQKRIDLCGSAGSRLDIYTMSWYTFRMACGYWRRCETCFRARKTEFESRYEVALQQCEGNVKGILVDSKKAAGSVVRALRKEKIDYWRLPTKDGIVILYDGYYTEIEANYPMDNPDWDILAWTAEGSRYSGDLGRSKEEKEEDTSESFVVQIPEIYFTLPAGKTHEQAYIESQIRTGDLDDLNFDQDEINSSCYYLGVNLRDVINEWGGEIFHESIVSKRLTLNSFTTNFFGGKNAPEEKKEPPPGFVQEEIVDFEGEIAKIWDF